MMADAEGTVEKIRTLLQTKDDTARFVGLGMLKSALDVSKDLQQDEETVSSLWDSISPRFLDRLLRTGSKPASSKSEPKEMLDLAVNVIHAFTNLLPRTEMSKDRLIGRIPRLISAIPYSSPATTQHILDIILALANSSEGSTLLLELEHESWSPLIEASLRFPDAFSILQWAWLKGTTAIPMEDEAVRERTRDKIQDAIRLMISIHSNTDAVYLIEFISSILRGLDADLIPQKSDWLEPLSKSIKNLAAMKPNGKARAAYTDCAAVFLKVFPTTAPQALFKDDPGSSKPLVFLFVTMLSVDLHASLHTLIPNLHKLEYPRLSQRLASVLDILTAFLGYLVSTADGDEEARSPSFSHAKIFEIQSSLHKTVAEVMEYLRDRWDTTALAFLEDLPSQQKTLTWGDDDEERSMWEDPIVSSSIGLIAIWLRDDDGTDLRKQAAGLMEIFLGFYSRTTSSEAQQDSRIPDLRLQILAALEGVLQTPRGREAFQDQSGFDHLISDLGTVTTGGSDGHQLRPADYIRGSAILVALNATTTDESRTAAPLCARVVELMAQYKVPTVDLTTENELTRAVLEWQVDAIQFALDLVQEEALRSSLPSRQTTVCRLKAVAEQIICQCRQTSDRQLKFMVKDLRTTLSDVS